MPAGRCARAARQTQKKAPEGAFFVGGVAAYFATTLTISRHLLE